MSIPPAPPAKHADHTVPRSQGVGVHAGTAPMPNRPRPAESFAAVRAEVKVAMRQLIENGKTRRVSHHEVEIAEDAAFQFNPRHLRPAPVDSIEWDRVNGLMRSQGGSGGVFFVRIAGSKESKDEAPALDGKETASTAQTVDDSAETVDQVVVVKSNSTIAQELFGTDLAALLNVRTPRMRVIDYSMEVLPV